jgi:hypothetical protein
MMLKHITHTSAKQILNPCVIALQVAFLGSLAIARARELRDFKEAGFVELVEFVKN